MKRRAAAVFSSIALLAMLAASCDRSRSASSAPATHTAVTDATKTLQALDSGPRVVFLGDSISAGLHLPAEQAFPAVLQKKLAAAGVPFTLANAGVSGDTSAGGRRRLDWVMKQRPAIVVVELGANDGLRGVQLDSVRKNLREIIERIRAKGAVPLLLGIRLPPSYGAEYTEAFAAIYPELARELDVAFVPFFMEGVAGVPELNLEDGIHPTQQGHERLADNLAPTLRRLLLALRDAGPPAGSTHAQSGDAAVSP